MLGNKCLIMHRPYNNTTSVHERDREGGRNVGKKKKRRKKYFRGLVARVMESLYSQTATVTTRVLTILVH